MSEKSKRNPLAFWRRIALVLVAALAATVPAQAGPGLVDQKTGHLVVGETDLALPAGGVLLELRRIASSGDEGGGILGPRWRLSVDKRVPAAAGETTRAFESGREIYRPDGRLSRIEMRNRGTVTLSYDASGRLTGISGPAGAAIRLTLNPAGRLVRAETTEGTAAEYRYLNGLLSEVQVRGRVPSRYIYDALRRISRIDDPATGSTAINYDAKHRVVLRRFANGATETIAFDDARNERRVTDLTGGITTTTRSSDGLEETSLDAVGRRTEIRYDAQGRLVSIAVDGREPVRTAYDRLGRITSTGASGKELRYEYVGDTPLVSSLTFPDGARHIYSYDANQQLLAIREGEETLLQFSYTGNGLPASVRKRGKPEVRYAYRPDGRLASESDSTGRTWQHEYDTRGNVIRERSNGRITSYEYDSQDRLIAITDPAGAVTRYTLDSAGRRTRITNALGGAIGFEYDAAGRLIGETDAAGRNTRYRYDNAGRVEGITYPGGRTRSFVYGRAGNLLRAVNPAGGVTRYDYDASGQLVRVTDPVERVWTYEYSAPSQVGRMVAPDGLAVEVLYDQQRRRIGWADDAGSTVRLERDAQGRVATIRLPGGLAHNITYDKAGRPVAEETSFTPKVERQFDEAGRVTRVRNSTGAQTDYRYDASGALAEVKESSGAVLTYEYDARGLRTAAKDSQGRVSRFSYDLLGRLTQITGPGPGSRRLNYSSGGGLERVQEPNGDAVQLAYDAAGHLRRVVHPSGVATEFERDAFGNPVKVGGPLGAETRYAYDAAGRLLREVDPAGGVRSYQYDAAGRISEKRLPDGRTVRYFYDRAGRQTSVDDGIFPVRYAYDAAGRLNRIEYPTLRSSLGYEYDSSGRLVKFRAPGAREIGYSYDAHKRLTGIVLPGGKSIRMEYDPAGLLAAMAYPNGVRGVWQRDPAGRLLKVAYTDAVGKTIDGTSYEYDAAGEIARVQPAGGTSSEYRYDASGQLLEETTGNSSVRYSYLPGGDRALRDAGGQATAYKYNEAGRLVEAGAEALAYDTRGNLTNKGSPAGATRYSWDAMNRLERLVLAAGDEVRYGYAASGERIWRQDRKGRTWFVTDGVNLIADLDESFTVQALYVHAPGIDRPLAVLTANGTQFYHSNALGSITSLTDDAGQLVASYAYDAFGAPVEIKGQSPNRLLHLAREYDSVTGLYYLRARYYDPRLGRFLSVDPLWADWTDPLALNRYAYVRNAPTRYVDPSGANAFPTYADISTAWELTMSQWNDIMARMKAVEKLFGFNESWHLAEIETARRASQYTGTVNALGEPHYRSVTGQELYESVMRGTERPAGGMFKPASNQPQPGPAAEPPPAVNSAGQPQRSSNAPSNPSPEEVAGAGRPPVAQPAPVAEPAPVAQPAPVAEPAPQPPVENSPPADSAEWNYPTVDSPPRAAAAPAAPPPRAAAAEVVKGPSASTFGPQSRMPTLEVEVGTRASLGLAVLGTELSIAADIVEGRDVGQSIKEHAVAAVEGGLLVGVPLYFAATGTGVLASVAAAAGPVLVAGGLGYGVYRFYSAVTGIERPALEAEAGLAQQRDVNAALAGEFLPELRDLVTSGIAELQSLRTRYDAASASVTANAAGIRERAARIQGLLATMRAALQPTSEPAGAAPQFKEWEDALAAKVREANSLANACASEADAAGALTAYNDAVGRASYIVSQADAARAAPPPATTDVAGLRDRIVSDAGAMVAMQGRLVAAWSSLAEIKGQFESRRLALIGRIQGARSALPPNITPNQQALFDQLSATVQGTRLNEQPTQPGDSPEAIQILVGAAVEAKLDAQNLVARAEAAGSSDPAPEAAEASASSSVILLASAEGVPAKVQACRDRLASASDGFVSLGGENKVNNDDNKPQQKETPQSQPAGANASLPNVTPNQPQPETELLTRNSIRQSMDSAQAQSDRLKQDQQAPNQLQQAQMAEPQQTTRRPGLLEVLTTIAQGYNTMRTGMNSPAGFQTPQASQYYANMVDKFREQNGGRGPSSDQLTSLLSTIQRLQSQAGGGQSASAVQPQNWIGPISQGQQPASYGQPGQLLGQVLGAQPAQQTIRTTQQPQQPQTQPQKQIPQQQQSVKTTAPTPQKSPQPAVERPLTCSQQFCQQCIAGKMGTGYTEFMSCQTCEWALRPNIIKCEARLAKDPSKEFFQPEMNLYCVSARDTKTGKCSVLKMEWSDLRPPKDPTWYYMCGRSAGECRELIEKIKRVGYADYLTAPWEGVTFIMPQGW
jgi:RHS repeat-associated protein